MSIAKAAAKAGRAAGKAASKVAEFNRGVAREFKNNVKDGITRAGRSVKHAINADTALLKGDLKGYVENGKNFYKEIVGKGDGAKTVTRKAMSRMALKSRPSANAQPAKKAVATLANGGIRYSDGSVSMPARKRD